MDLIKLPKMKVEKWIALAMVIAMSLAASCGNNKRSNYRPALNAASNQNRYANFRQMSALALNRKRTQNTGLGLQGKMMMMAMEAQIKSKQETDKLAATIAIGGGAAVLGVGVVGAIAAAISSKKADKAEAAARDKQYAFEIEKAQIAADAKVAQAAIYAGNYNYNTGRGPAALKPRSDSRTAADDASGTRGTGSRATGSGNPAATPLSDCRIGFADGHCTATALTGQTCILASDLVK